jgi:hypothetical protein
MLAGGSVTLSWNTRLTIAIAAARGLAFLHVRDVIYRYLKSWNILLDKDFNPKLSFSKFSVSLSFLIPRCDGGKKRSVHQIRKGGSVTFSTLVHVQNKLWLYWLYEEIYIQYQQHYLPGLCDSFGLGNLLIKDACVLVCKCDFFFWVYDRVWRLMRGLLKHILFVASYKRHPQHQKRCSLQVIRRRHKRGN